MSSQATRQSGAAVALAREIAAVEDEYRDALQAAARDLQPTKAGAAAVEGSVASGPLVELNPDAAMAIHTLETRLDQLKEIQQWAKVDPRLLRFAEGQATRHTSVAASSPQQPDTPVQQSAPRRSALTLILIGALALIVGWLLSLALPATVLLGR
ncbi:MAG TPA: hypothetical protein VHR15_00170 [Ktedonobacterales bacterium]|jgi:LPS O-antigen subunit length determinant protein (WzzB/FepE family)|nr:hypothetical protein [Ktedonobacterales bacterium]